MAVLRKIKKKIEVTTKRKAASDRKPVKKTEKRLSKPAEADSVRNAGIPVPIGKIKIESKTAVSNRVKKEAAATQGQEKEISGYESRPGHRISLPEGRIYEETFVEKTKFYPPAGIESVTTRLPKELPLAYGEDKIVLLARDPRWLYTYWEVTQDKWETLKQQLNRDFYSAKKVLRVYDVSDIIFDGNNAHSFFDIEIGIDTDNWYINADCPGRSWCVDLGLRLVDGRFITIIRSNVVNTPIDGPSWITDEEWMIPEEMFARLYGMGFGFGRTSPGKARAESMRRALFSGGLSSSGSSPVKNEKGRKFWFVLDCELIVYGATDPDAKVKVQGKEIKLRPDGTFTLRFALPDGKQVIPAVAVSADNIEERAIIPAVTIETKNSISIRENAAAFK